MRGALKTAGMGNGLAKIEKDGRPIGVAEHSYTFADKPIVKTAHKRRTEHAGEADNEPLTVVDGRKLRNISGEIRLAVRAGVPDIVAQRAKHRKTMLAVLGDVVIRSRDIHVLRIGGWSCKNKTLIVEAIACDTAVRLGQALEIFERRH